MFFTQYGTVVERQLSETEVNPGDIVVELKKENTAVVNNTSVPVQQPVINNRHETVNGNMPPIPSANRFKQQMDHLSSLPNFDLEEEDYPSKQGKRNSRPFYETGANVARRQERSESNSGKKKVRQKDRRQERSSKRSQQGRVVEMTLAGVSINGRSQPFESGTSYG